MKIEMVLLTVTAMVVAPTFAGFGDAVDDVVEGSIASTSADMALDARESPALTSQSSAAALSGLTHLAAYTDRALQLLRRVPDRMYPNEPRLGPAVSYRFSGPTERAMTAITEHLKRTAGTASEFDPEADVYQRAFGPSFWERIRGRGDEGRARRNYLVGTLAGLKREVSTDEWNALLALRPGDFAPFSLRAEQRAAIGLQAVVRAQSKYSVAEDGSKLSAWNERGYSRLLAKGGFIDDFGNQSPFAKRIMATLEMLSNKGLSTQTKAELLALSEPEIGRLALGNAD